MTQTQTTLYTSGVRSISDMVDVAYQYDQAKHDHVLSPHFNGRYVTVEPNMAPCVMEDGAIIGLCGRLTQRLGKPIPSAYFRHVDADIFEHALNRHIEQSKKQQFMLRCSNDRVRAVVSDRYPAFGSDGMFENRLMLETLHRIVHAHGPHTLVRPTITRDNLTCKVVWKDLNTPDGVYGVGCLITNSEVGDGAFGVSALIQRHSCTNSIVFDVGQFEEGRKRIPHIGGTAKFIVAMQELDKARGAATMEAMHWLQRLLDARSVVIRDIHSEIEKLAKQYKWDEATTIQVGIGTEGQPTVAGLVNGITWAAHQASQDADGMLEMERLGAYVLRDYTARAQRRDAALAR